MSVHAPDLSGCGANAGSGCNRAAVVLLDEAQGVLLGAGEEVDQRYGSCYLPVQLNSTLAGFGTVVGFDSSAAVETVAVSAEVGSSPLLLLLHCEVAAASWLRLAVSPLGQ